MYNIIIIKDTIFRYIREALLCHTLSIHYKTLSFYHEKTKW